MNGEMPYKNRVDVPALFRFAVLLRRKDVPVGTFALLASFNYGLSEEDHRRVFGDFPSCDTTARRICHFIQELLA